MAKVIMTSTELVQRLKVLANKKSYYKNKYPYNLCLVNPPSSIPSFMTYNNSMSCHNLNPYESIAISADCVNLYKALLNGYDVSNRTIGYYQSSLSNTGDCNEWGLISQCSDISSDFTKLKAGVPRLLYKSGHIGGYIGEEVTRDGHVYNVIECTAAWQRGILYSYVDSKGRRYQYKDGSQNGAWTHHGLMTPWIQYVKPNPNEYDGVNYSAVYDLKFYKNKYSDLKQAYGDNDSRYLEHFVKFGMKEGRQAKEDFCVWVYQYLYPDLQDAYKDDIAKYYIHYINFGKNEGRTALISYFDHVYNSKYYDNKYPDLHGCGGDNNLLIKHFVQNGMKEGRRASEDFIVQVYKVNYKDLREAFGNNLPLYYMHYIKFGYNEHREAVRSLGR